MGRYRRSSSSARTARAMSPSTRSSASRTGPGESMAARSSRTPARRFETQRRLGKACPCEGGGAPAPCPRGSAACGRAQKNAWARLRLCPPYGLVKLEDLAEHAGRDDRERVDEEMWPATGPPD